MNFYIECLGCKVNTYEIEAIKDELILNGFKLVHDIKDADYIIVNTCCVTNTAASKSRQKINSLHKENNKAKIAIMGCYVQGFEDEAKELEGVSLLVGTKDRRKIVEYLLNDRLESMISLVEDVKYNTVFESLGVCNYFENTRAFLKIQDGCNNYCSYCIIPYVRGTIKSRPFDEVINEAKELVNKGYKEIVLTGIHTGSYGRDLNGIEFSSLVEKLLDIDGLYRLRISSLEESEIDDKLIELLKTRDNFAKHLHIPFQAGSNHVLKLMNRKYDVDRFINKINLIKKEIKDVAITTDIIVGFPQESDADFEDTLNNSKLIGFSKIHVFPFSSRKGTVASRMNGHINGNIKKERAHKLIELSNKLNLEYNQRYLNQIVDVLVEEKVDDYYVGHTSNFIKVKFKSDNDINRNDIINVRIIKAFTNDVEGELL